MRNYKNSKCLILTLIGLLLWGLSIGYYKFSLHKRTVNTLERVIQSDITSRQAEVAAVLANEGLMNRIWTNQLTELDLNFLSQQKFIVQLFVDGQLDFWNKNALPVSEKRFLPKWQCIHEQENYFLYRSIGNAKFSKRRLNFILPIFQHFEIANNYLSSNFSASSLIPSSSTISFSPKDGYKAIQSLDGSVLFYLNIDEANIAPYRPDWILLCFVMGALLTTVLGLQLLSIELSRNKSAFLGVGFILLVLIAGQLLLYRFGLPFGLGNLDVFSPVIFASNKITPSFGHLFLHVLSIYWFFSLLLAQFDKVSLLYFDKKTMLDRWFFVVVELGICMVIIFYLQYLLRSLVYDSDISFDTNNFNAADKFTFFAIVIIAVIARILFLKIQLANTILKRIIPFSSNNNFIVFFIIVFFYVVLGLLLDKNNQGHFGQWLDWFAIIWGVVFLFSIGSKQYQKILPNDGLFSMIFVSVYFSIFFGLYFKNYIDEKEKNMLRVSFAEKLSRQQNSALELGFKQSVESITKDTLLRDWLLFADTLTEADVIKYLRIKNADLFYNNYDLSISIFDAVNKPVLENYDKSLDSFVALKKSSIPTISDCLFFRLDKNQQGAYLGIIPVTDSIGVKLLGTLVIDFVSKQNVVRSIYPKLLNNQAEGKRGAGNFEYDYATYNNCKLITQSGNYDFDHQIKDNLQVGEKRYIEKENYSELYYKISNNKIYVVVYQNNKLLGVITIFSFLFGVFLLIASLEKWFSIISANWLVGTKQLSFYNNSMSVRIKYFVLGFTGVSFFVIGITTILFLNKKNVDSSTRKIKEQSTNLAEAIEDYIHNQNVVFRYHFDENSVFENKDFVFFLTNIAKQQKIDLNLFDTTGKLVFSSHDNLYKANALSRNMSYNAKYNLQRKRLSSFLQPEKVGKLNFTASYIPIFDAHNNFLGYLNVPFFFTNEELNGQIISLVTTLVNIYTILILVSSFITFLFINNLTKSLRLVADKLKNVNLKKNELIVWPYKDEIGLLVEEYNKMVSTVEKNARSLVLDERQNAWREMAQQVAHEIKNPLTPMKLNIQYLQQAINSNHPDIINLTKRVSSSIIEQIDNLNYIASEFSNFAKMPENKTDRIDLKTMLENIVLLFAGNKNIKITHSLPQEQAIVYADKSQMLRIFTNIVQNAVEAMPHDKTNGQIHIELLPNNDTRQVMIKVSDNGSGIPDEVKDKIFDPYFTTKSSGTGLGLAMSKKIVELWGGTIRFDSEMDTGTIFYLNLPMG